MPDLLYRDDAYLPEATATVTAAGPDGVELDRTVFYASSGGQPGHATAWEDDAVNAATGNFYRNTRKTLEAAYVRPRHTGYMAFQDAASKRLNAGLIGREAPAAIVADLNRMFRESF